MGLGHLVATVQAVDGAGGGGEERDVSEKGSSDDVAFDIERGNRRHQEAASQAWKLFSSFSRSRSRPMKTSRVSRFSPSFQGRW